MAYRINVKLIMQLHDAGISSFISREQIINDLG